MLTESRALRTILRRGSGVCCVVEDRLQPVVLLAFHVRTIVDDDAGQSLTLSSSADEGLQRVAAETLVSDDPVDGVQESAHLLIGAMAGKGECQVIRVPRVRASRCRGEAGEAPIEPESSQVGEDRRGRRPLREVRVGETPAEAAVRRQ
jgi:hypothetical protein